MIQRKLGLMLAAVLCVPSAGLFAQDRNVPSQAREEILRRGNCVQKIDGIQSDGSVEQLFGDALKPPADDSDKWFVTLLVGNGCAPCERLKSDWKTSEYLRAWAKPEDPQKGWAFFFCVNIDDPKQAKRYEKIQVVGKPTIIVQPPRNGAYGDPSTVVAQITGYSGDDRALSNKMASAVQAYLVKLQSRKLATPIQSPTVVEPQSKPELPTKPEGIGGVIESPPAPTTAAVIQTESVERIEGFGQAPPFQIPPSVPTPTVQIPPIFPQPQPQPTTPTTPTPTPQSPIEILIGALVALLGGGGMNNLLMLGLLGFTMYRHHRQQQGQKVFLDDETYKRLIADVQAAADAAAALKPK